MWTNRHIFSENPYLISIKLYPDNKLHIWALFMLVDRYNTHYNISRYRSGPTGFPFPNSRQPNGWRDNMFTIIPGDYRHINNGNTKCVPPTGERVHNLYVICVWNMNLPKSFPRKLGTVDFIFRNICSESGKYLALVSWSGSVKADHACTLYSIAARSHLFSYHFCTLATLVTAIKFLISGWCSIKSSRFLDSTDVFSRYACSVFAAAITLINHTQFHHIFIW